ncbi:hypothetical protein PG994_013552 [Apiospora phragmitis]|uniref:Uncharacterized protein n=1 Tax=Apiospora phragmitis TaxID=2905665 RepID=A0ABR1TB89_9PEZI
MDPNNDPVLALRHASEIPDDKFEDTFAEYDLEQAEENPELIPEHSLEHSPDHNPELPNLEHNPGLYDPEHNPEQAPDYHPMQDPVQAPVQAPVQHGGQGTAPGSAQVSYFMHPTEVMKAYREVTKGGLKGHVFGSIAHAHQSWQNWLAIGNVGIKAGSNDRDRNGIHPESNQDLVQRLYEAFRNLIDTFEERKKKTPDAEAFSKPIRKVAYKVPDLDLQILCWRLLDTIYNAQAGISGLPITYTSQGNGYGAFDSFMERFDAVEECLRHSKLICKDMLNGDEYICRLAWNPTAELRMGNARRDVQNRTGALAINHGLIELHGSKAVAPENKKVGELGDIELPRVSKPLQAAMEKIPSRNSRSDVAKAQETPAADPPAAQTRRAVPPTPRPVAIPVPQIQAPAPQPSVSQAPEAQGLAHQDFGSFPELAAFDNRSFDAPDPAIQGPGIQALVATAPAVETPVMEAAAAQTSADLGPTVQTPIISMPQPERRAPMPLLNRARSDAVPETQDAMAAFAIPERPVPRTPGPALQQMGSHHGNNAMPHAGNNAMHQGFYNNGFHQFPSNGSYAHPPAASHPGAQWQFPNPSHGNYTAPQYGGQYPMPGSSAAAFQSDLSYVNNMTQSHMDGIINFGQPADQQCDQQYDR